MTKKSTNSMSASIVSQIKDRQIKMKSRFHFTAIFLLSVFSIIVSSFIVSYLFSVLVLWVKIQNADTMAWGARSNLDRLLTSFPWWSLLLAVVLIVLSIWLIRKQGTMYRYRKSTIITIFIILTLVAGVGMSQINILHPNTNNQNTHQRSQNIKEK